MATNLCSVIWLCNVSSSFWLHCFKNRIWICLSVNKTWCVLLWCLGVVTVSTTELSFSIATKLTVCLHGKTGTAAIRRQSCAVERSELYHWTFLSVVSVYPETLIQQKDYFAGLLCAVHSFVSAFCSSSDCANAKGSLQTIFAFPLDFWNQIWFNIVSMTAESRIGGDGTDVHVSAATNINKN